MCDDAASAADPSNVLHKARTVRDIVVAFTDYLESELADV